MLTYYDVPNNASGNHGFNAPLKSPLSFTIHFHGIVIVSTNTLHKLRLWYYIPDFIILEFICSEALSDTLLGPTRRL